MSQTASHCTNCLSTVSVVSLGDFLSSRIPGVAAEHANHFVHRRVDYRVGRLLRTFNLSDADGDDLRQDFLLALFTGMAGYRAGESRWQTYARAILDRRYRHHVRQLMCAEQHDSMKPISLDDLDPEANDFVSTQADPVHDYNREDLRVDVAEVLLRLPVWLRGICVLLSEHSAAETARILGVGKATIHRAVGMIRPHFLKAGFGKE